MTWQSIVVSILIVASGWFGARELTGVDQSLRVIYAEYTLAATDLGHVNGELIRYRTTVIRAIEADTKEDFQRIAESLPNKRVRIDTAMDRFVKATNEASLGKGIDARELVELKAVRDKLEECITTSQRTIQLIEKRWQATSQMEALQWKRQAELHSSNEAAGKFISVTLELDRLLEVVAAIAGDVRKEAESSIRVITIAFIAVCLALATLILCLPMPARQQSPRTAS